MEMVRRTTTRSARATAGDRARVAERDSSIGPRATDGADVGDVGDVLVGVGGSRAGRRGRATRDVRANDDRGEVREWTTRGVRARGRGERARGEGWERGGGDIGRVVVVSRARRRGRSGEIVARW